MEREARLMLPIDLRSIISTLENEAKQYLPASKVKISYMCIYSEQLTLKLLKDIRNKISNTATARSFLNALLILKIEIEDCLGVDKVLKIGFYFHDLCNIQRFESGRICSQVQSALIKGINCAEGVLGLLNIGKIIRKLEANINTFYEEPWKVLELAFASRVLELLESNEEKNTILALSYLIQAEKINLVSECAFYAVIRKAIEYIESFNDVYRMNSLLKLSPLNREASSIFNGILRLIKLEYASDLYREINNLNRFEIKRIKTIEKNYKPNHWELDSLWLEYDHNHAYDHVLKLNEIDIEQDAFKLHSSLGKKVTTLLYKAKIISTGKTVAVKKINTLDANLKAKYMKEAEFLKKVSGQKNFLEFYGIFVDRDDILIVMEYINKNLLDAIQDGSVDFSRNEVLTLKIVKELVESFSILQTYKIYHRDIKPQNILLKNENTPVIIDFGISEYADLDLIRNTNTGFRFAQGTPDYMSPELIQAFQSKSSVSKIDPLKSDVYSLGLTIYQMITKEDLSKYQGVAGNSNLIYDIDKKIKSSILKEVLHAMLNFNPLNRSTFQELLKHFPSEQTLPSP